MGRVATIARAVRAVPVVTAALALALVTRPSSSAPKQARDYILEPPPRGAWATVDAYTLGAQGALELRIPIEDESTGMVHLRASSLASHIALALPGPRDRHHIRTHVGQQHRGERAWSDTGKFNDAHTAQWSRCSRTLRHTLLPNSTSSCFIGAPVL